MDSNTQKENIEKEISIPKELELSTVKLLTEKICRDFFDSNKNLPGVIDISITGTHVSAVLESGIVDMEKHLKEDELKMQSTTSKNISTQTALKDLKFKEDINGYFSALKSITNRLSNNTKCSNCDLEVSN